jgi:hypothetical protein
MFVRDRSSARPYLESDGCAPADAIGDHGHRAESDASADKEDGERRLRPPAFVWRRGRPVAMTKPGLSSAGRPKIRARRKGRKIPARNGTADGGKVSIEKRRALSENPAPAHLFRICEK